MAEKSFPFAAVNEDRKYGATDWAAYFSQFITNGVFPVGSQLQVTAGTGMQINVSAGGAWINGYGYVNGSAYTLNIDAADGVLNRIDRIVVRWGRVERAIYLGVIKGIPASSPAAPALVRDADYYDLCIAQVSVPAGITAVVSGHITDKRLDPAVCGIVSSLITPNTAGWYDGWEAEYQAWLASVQGLLEGDPATQLAAAITAAQFDIDKLEAVNAPIVTGGTAPNFTLTPSPAISAYADGQAWTVRFHADAVNPTLNVSGKGAGGIYTATGKAAIVKSGQIVRVMRYGTSFFTLSGGGGATGKIKTLIFTSSGNWTVPDGVTTVTLRMFGGGGGGSAAGGGGGHMFYGIVDVTPGEVIPVTIGPGGTGSSSNGTSGGATSFGSYATASGGSGAVGYNGGHGGTGGGARHNAPGGNGSYGGGGGGGGTYNGGNGGIYGGGGGGGGDYNDNNGGSGGLGGQYGGKGGNGARPGIQAQPGSNGTNTTNTNEEFRGTGAGGGVLGTSTYYPGGGGGGYGGNGGKGGSRGSSSGTSPCGGGGGGYGANGADANYGGGGGGGYGGNGKTSGSVYGGGGGGYGPSNYGAGGNGGITGENGTSGICLVYYMEVA